MRFIESFTKLDKKLYGIVVALEYCFFAVSAAVILLIGNYLNNLNVPELDMYASEAVLEAWAVTMDSVLTTIVWMVILLLVLLWLNFSFWRGLVWTKILKKRFSFKVFLRFCLLNLWWLIVFSIIVLVVGMIISWLVSGAFMYLALTLGDVWSWVIMLPIYILVIAPIAVYVINITNILHIKFFTEKNYKHIIGKTWHTITKIRKLCVPYILMGIVGIILVLIQAYVPIFSVATTVGIFISLILAALYCSWLKLYVVKLIKKI